MPQQRVLHAVPVALWPTRYSNFTRCQIGPGVQLQRFVGPIASDIRSRHEGFPVPIGFTPTHLILVDQAKYLLALDARLKSEALSRPKAEFEAIDIRGIVRQTLIALTLTSRLAWTVGGYHAFDSSDADFPYTMGGYSHASTEAVSEHFRTSMPSGWFKPVDARRLRRISAQLDRYYRSGIWWNDRLSISLGYLWSAVCSSHAELAFVAMCMAMEALATTSSAEVTHTLAERCAVLARKRGPDRITAFTEIKQLYGLRSAIVHGRSGMRKGPVTYESLAITAKMSMVPRSKVLSLLGYLLDTIGGALSNGDLQAILRTRQSEDSEGKAVERYFEALLLAGRA